VDTKCRRTCPIPFELCGNWCLGCETLASILVLSLAIEPHATCCVYFDGPPNPSYYLGLSGPNSRKVCNILLTSAQGQLETDYAASARPKCTSNWASLRSSVPIVSMFGNLEIYWVFIMSVSGSAMWPCGRRTGTKETEFEREADGTQILGMLQSLSNAFLALFRYCVYSTSTSSAV